MQIEDFFLLSLYVCFNIHSISFLVIVLIIIEAKLLTFLTCHQLGTVILGDSEMKNF